MKKLMVILLVVIMMVMVILPAMTVSADWPPPEDKGSIGEGQAPWADPGLPQGPAPWTKPGAA